MHITKQRLGKSVCHPQFFITFIEFGILNFGNCDLPFDVAQGGELVEPFVICDLFFVI